MTIIEVTFLLMCMLTLIESIVCLYVYHILLREDIAYVHFASLLKLEIAYVHADCYWSNNLLICGTGVIECRCCLCET